MLHSQGQVTTGRLTTLLNNIGLDISKCQAVRLVTGRLEGFAAEDAAVLHAGLVSSSYVTVDDTGARHSHNNGHEFFSPTKLLSLLNFFTLQPPAAPLSQRTGTRHITSILAAIMAGRAESLSRLLDLIKSAMLSHSIAASLALRPLRVPAEKMRGVGPKARIQIPYWLHFLASGGALINPKKNFLNVILSR